MSPVDCGLEIESALPAVCDVLESQAAWLAAVGVFRAGALIGGA